MSRYETLILAVPEITADESTMIEQQFDTLIKKKQGSIISFERWGKYRLAYSVRKNEYGVYFLTRFEFNPGANLDFVAKDLEEFFAVKHGQLIMRHVVTKLNSRDNLQYIKPDSLEDVPTQDIDTFLRDNRDSKLKKFSDENSSERALMRDSADSFEDDAEEDNSEI